MNFKEIADSITDRSEIEEALKKAYDQGVLDEYNRWWSDLEKDEDFQAFEQASLTDLNSYLADGYYRCYHNPGGTDGE